MSQKIATTKTPWLGGTICLACLLLSGCANRSMFSSDVLKPFSGGNEVEYDYGITPAERLKQLQETAESADNLSPAEAQSLALDMGSRLTNEADPLLRIEIVRLLGHLNTPDANPSLRLALQDDDVDVRIAACKAWQRRRDPQSIDALGETLASDTDLDVRIAAAEGLGDFKDPRAYQALIVALDDRDPALQYQGVMALGKASGRNYGGNVQSWREFALGGSPKEEPQSTWASRFTGWF